VPLTEALPPGMGDDWLYTGRAVAVNSVPVSAGWMVVMREDTGPDTFWRVYVRARLQDGSQGVPLKRQPWDFNARYSGKPQVYEQGGTLSHDIPAGYWVDFTDLALRYGWERLPALINWRTFFPAARFNEFILSDRSDWRTAILQIYPPEVLITPTPIIPPTITPSPSSTPAFSIAPTETFPAPPSFIVLGTPTATATLTATLLQVNTADPSQNTIVPAKPVPQVVTPTPSPTVQAAP
jgi:TolB protein